MVLRRWCWLWVLVWAGVVACPRQQKKTAPVVRVRPYKSKIPFSLAAVRGYNTQKQTTTTDLPGREQRDRFFQEIRLFWDKYQQTPLRRDPLLERAASEYSHLLLHYHRRLQRSFARYLLWRHGITDADFLVFLGRFTRQGRKGFTRQLTTFLKQLLVRKQRLTHVGVGWKYSEEEKSEIVTFYFVDRKIRLKPLWRRIHPNEYASLQGVLRSEYRSIQLEVTSPKKNVLRPPLRVRKKEGRLHLRARIPLRGGEGRYRLILQAVGPRGPEVVARFPLFAGGQPFIPPSPLPKRRRVIKQIDPVVAQKKAVAALNNKRQDQLLKPLRYVRSLSPILRRQACRFLALRGATRRKFAGQVGRAVAPKTRQYLRASLHTVIATSPKEAANNPPERFSKKYNTFSVGVCQKDSKVYGRGSTAYVFLFLYRPPPPKPRRRPLY